MRGLRAFLIKYDGWRGGGGQEKEREKEKDREKDRERERKERGRERGRMIKGEGE